jgi:asparagine synthase (glutamine-hydrolysing)
MQVVIDIKENKHLFYQWKQDKNLYFISNDTIRLDYDTRILKTLWIEKIKKIKNNFALLIDEQDFVLACVDAIRCFPLFYKLDENILTITNSIEQKNESINQNQIQFFVQNFCTENQETLLNNWKQLQVGEYLFFDKLNNTIEISTYFSYKDFENISIKNLDDVYQYLISKIKNIVDINEACTFVVPLSGGYDSRAILCLLKEAGAKNIFTYTYGNKNADEKLIAQKVANKLQLPWIFIEYTDELLDVFFTSEWRRYAQYNHHFSSLPHEQDFFALHYLSQNNLIPKDAIFFPGYLGDYYAGSMYKDAYSIHNFKQKKESYLFWYLNNRGSKFIVNAVRSFEYFGYQWQLIWYDTILMPYFFDNLNGKEHKLFETFLMQYLFIKNGVDFYKTKPKKYKQFIKRFIPTIILELYQKYNANKPQNDAINSNLLSKKIINFDKHKKYPKSQYFNQIHAQYFLNLIKIK